MTAGDGWVQLGDVKVIAVSKTNVFIVDKFHGAAQSIFVRFL